MRHVITGGSGFLGKALARQLLAAGCKVVIFDKVPPDASLMLPELSFVQGDVTKQSDFRKLGLSSDDVVYHLAARQFGSGVPRVNRGNWFDEVNFGGTDNLVREMVRGGARKVVYFSTDMTYGLPLSCPVAPDHIQNPIGPYGASKLKAEVALRDCADIDATIFRPRLITGPGRLGILGTLFKLIQKGFPVPMIGSGRNRYQMVGVEDCARAAVLAANSGCPPGPFNLGSEAPPSTRDLLQQVITHAKSRSRLVPLPALPVKALLAVLDQIGTTVLHPEQFRIADVDFLLDTSSTRNVLGWSPRSDDIAMMKSAYDFFLRRDRP